MILQGGWGLVELSLSVPGSLGWETCLSSRLPFFLHVVSHHSPVSLSILTWRLASERHKVEAAWPPKGWAKASHRAAWRLEERKQIALLGGRTGVSLQDCEGRGLLGTIFADSPPHSMCFGELQLAPCNAASPNALVTWLGAPESREKSTHFSYL